MTASFLLGISVFVFSFLHYYFLGSVWQIKLAVRQLLDARISHRIVSYRIVSYRFMSLFPGRQSLQRCCVLAVCVVDRARPWRHLSTPARRVRQDVPASPYPAARRQRNWKDDARGVAQVRIHPVAVPSQWLDGARRPDQG